MVIRRLWGWHSSVKTRKKKEGGGGGWSARASPVAALMPKSVYF